MPGLAASEEYRTSGGVIVPGGSKPLKQNNQRLDDFLWVISVSRPTPRKPCGVCGSFGTLPKRKGFRWYKLPCPCCHGTGLI